MTINLEQEEIVTTEGIPAVVPAEASAEVTPAARSPRGGRTVRGRSPRAGGRGGQPRERGEFEQVTIDARRVARVMAGGRRFNFSLRGRYRR